MTGFFVVACGDIRDPLVEHSDNETSKERSPAEYEVNFNTWIKGFPADQSMINAGKAVATDRFNCEACHHGAAWQAGIPVLKGMPAP